jgi:magnesium transporter
MSDPSLSSEPAAEETPERLSTRDAAASTPERVASAVEDLPAEQGASMLASLETEHAADIIEVLDPPTAARILGEMDSSLAATMVADMEVPEAAMVLGEMNPDDRVDILGHLPPESHDALVRELEPHEAAEVHALEQYPTDTAGGIMTTEVTALYEYITVDDAVSLLRKLSEELEQMYYVYVINRRGHLVGVLSMRDLILARPAQRLRDIMIRGVRSVPATMDQEDVARFMRQTGYLAVPVVDGVNRLVGLITADDVQDVLVEEATEDVQKLFGAGAEERLTSPWQVSFKSRVWWLIINLGTAFLAGWVVGLFEDTIELLPVLAIYMPIVAGMGGNASAQAMAVSVRGLAMAQVTGRTLRHVMLRELIVGVLTGLVIGLITASVALLWQGSPNLGLVVGAALVFNHIMASTSGASIPFVMRRLGFDPAQSATIFATTITDICGFFVLLGLAAVFLKG